MLLDQIRALDNRRISSKIESVDLFTMLQVEEALRIPLGAKEMIV